MDSKGIAGYDIRSEKYRFVIISIFFLVAFGVNSTERVKIWFRNEVRTDLL
jgi:hypothetical protein